MSILIKNLVKYYGELLIVNSFNLEIADGEFFALLGASGSGKSTVLRMIAGLTVPSSGSIELGGKDVTFLPPQKREVGMVFQNYAIFKHMTVAANIEFGLKVRGVSKQERTTRQEELLEIVGLSGMGSRYPHQISGGQRQRVALARALVYKPSVLLLDEPFGALDAAIRSQLRESVRDIQRKLKITTILVTHDQEEAFELADRIGIINKGKLVELGSAHSLYHKPKSSYAASFIGSGHVLVGRAGGGKIKLGKINLNFPADAPPHKEGDPVRVLFRPEDVICSKEPLNSQNDLLLIGEGIIEDSVFSGANLRTRVKITELSGVRPLNSSSRLGEGIKLSSFQPSSNIDSDLQCGRSCYVYSKHFHVLNPSGLRMLIKCSEPKQSSAAWVIGSMLASAAHGKATMLHVFDNASSVEKEKKKIESIFLPEINPELNLEFKIKQGDEHYQTLVSAQEDFFEIIIKDRDLDLSDGLFTGLDALSIALLQEGQVPVMLTAEPRSKLDKILVCTAAGEPGKYDVLIGARIARQTGASVTVLHVLKEQPSEEQKMRLERHLNEAKNVLTDLGVESETLIETGEPKEVILEIAKKEAFDLIVLGAPAPQESQNVITKSITSKIIAATFLPVLVVPMVE